MTKSIVICCDGTANEFSDSNSNVMKLYSALVIDGQRQIGYYHPGVGTMGAPTAREKRRKCWVEYRRLRRLRPIRRRKHTTRSRGNGGFWKFAALVLRFIVRARKVANSARRAKGNSGSLRTT